LIYEQIKICRETVAFLEKDLKSGRKYVETLGC